MRKTTNPKMIGAFVLGGLLLLVLAIGIFGSSRLFETTRTAVAYFDRSVAGLDQGAPVTFRGVRVGQVKKVALRVEAEKLSARIPVYLEFQLERIDWVGEEGFTDEQIQRLIDSGLRAKLVPQSLVTGKLMVELNFEPDTPARLIGGADVPEIPTTESEIQAFVSSLSTLPLQDLMASATQAVTQLNELLGQDQIDQVAPMALQTLSEYRKLAQDLRGRIGPLSQDLSSGAKAATESFQQADRSLAQMEREMTKTLEAVRAATQTLQQRVDILSQDLRGTSQAATGAFEQAERTLNSADQTLEPGSATQRQLRRALEEFANAARAVRSLAEKLERNPNALITGNQR